MKNKTLADRYDRNYRTQTAGIKKKLILTRWPRNRHEAVVHFCPPAKNLLEIGCGNGTVLYYLSNRYEKATGIELSQQRCEIAEKNLKAISTVEIINANIEEGLQKPNGYYDVILWADVIEHTVDVFKSMEEISRLLKSNGVLITATPNIAYFRYRIKLMSGKFPTTSTLRDGFNDEKDEMFDSGHLHYFTFGILHHLYQRVQIKPIRDIGYGRLGKFHNIRPQLLSGAALVIGKKF